MHKIYVFPVKDIFNGDGVGFPLCDDLHELIIYGFKADCQGGTSTDLYFAIGNMSKAGITFCDNTVTRYFGSRINS